LVVVVVVAAAAAVVVPGEDAVGVFSVVAGCQRAIWD
jgi:hypothetical protein